MEGTEMFDPVSYAKAASRRFSVGGDVEFVTRAIKAYSGVFKKGSCDSGSPGNPGFAVGNDCAKGNDGVSDGGSGGYVKPGSVDLDVKIKETELPAVIGEAVSVAPPKDRSDIDRYLSDVAQTKAYTTVNERLADLQRQAKTGDVRLLSIEMHQKKGTSPEDVKAGKYRFTSKRLDLHRSIKERMLKGSDTRAKDGAKPVAVFLIGPPGAGKTTAGKPFIEAMGVKFANINNDDVKAMLPEYRGWNAAMVHEESAHVVEKLVMPMAIARKHNILMDGVGKSSKKLLDDAKKLKDAGYDVHVVHVTVPTEKTVQRAWQRFAKAAFTKDSRGEYGRYVPLEYVAKDVDQKPTKTYFEMKDSGLMDSWRSMSTDVKPGQEPITLDKGGK